MNFMWGNLPGFTFVLVFVFVFTIGDAKRINIKSRINDIENREEDRPAAALRDEIVAERNVLGGLGFFADHDDHAVSHAVHDESAQRTAWLVSDSEKRTFWLVAIGAYTAFVGGSLLVWMKVLGTQGSSLEGPALDAVEHTVVSKDWHEKYVSASVMSTLTFAAKTFFIFSCCVVIAVLVNHFFIRPPCLGDAMTATTLFSKLAVCLVPLVTSLTFMAKQQEVFYWITIFSYFLIIPAVHLPPFSESCAGLEDCRGLKNPSNMVLRKVTQADCGLQGQTTMLSVIAWLLVLPWILPHKKMLHFGWPWIFGVYLNWSVLWRVLINHGDPHDSIDILIRTSLLCAALVVAIRKKEYLDRSYQERFVCDLKIQESSERIFGILRHMVPTHVIFPLVQQPGVTIANEVDRVTILFLVIADFDQFTRKLSPAKLLEFLNTQWTAIDNICAANNVTKIETVGEEYVAAVGVSPEDVLENTKYGHKQLLEKLFAAAGQILLLSSGDVKFKMGMHTGPIVAGVVGQKLPRFRLFGDTINTSARQMQKGEVGKLQFGENTYNELPESIKGQVSYRGEVEMKGKGKVKAWHFAPGNKNLGLQTAFKSPPMIQKGGETHDSVEEDDQRDDKPGTWVKRMTIQVKEKVFQQVAHDIAMKDNADQDARKLHRIWGEEGVMSKEMEDEWARHFHETCTCNKMEMFTGRTSLAICAFSCLEVACAYYVREFQSKPDSEAAKLKLMEDVHKYMLFRAMALLVMLGWWYLSGNRKILLAKGFWAVQVCLTLSYSMVLILVYVSYGFLNDSRAPASSLFLGEEIRFERPPRAQIFSLLFVIIYCAIVQQIHVRMRCAAVFVVVAIVMMGINAIDYGMWGRVLFVSIALMTLGISYQEELNSRLRFKMNHAIQQTETRIQHILDTLMPPLVVQELRTLSVNAPSPSHKFRHATIAQSDLCGFTMLSSTCTPPQVVDFISELFGMFDCLTDKYDVYKVETVGDAYIAGQADQPLTLKNSPINVILFGMAMVKAVGEWSQKRGFNVNCRVGVHHGECIGGIVGTVASRYHLFGDLLTGLEILESTAPEGGVQVSKACKEEVERQLLDEGPREDFPGFEMRNEPNLKTSKGEIHEYEEIGGTSYIVKNM